ncbi:MAG: pyridoxamine 5'-phosphate oxidase family protein [Dehalococcoidia bacterium]
MHETTADLERLQATIDRSIAEAGPFLRSSFQMPEHSFSAQQLVEFFGDNRVVALATATASGAPRVAPIGCFLNGGVFYIPTTRAAARSRMIARRPRVSLTAFEGIDLAVIVHGSARLIDEGAPEFDRLDAAHLAGGMSSTSVRTWGKGGDGCFIAITPETLVSFTRVVSR